MESLSFPIKMVGGSESKVAKPDQDEPNIKSDSGGDQYVNDSNDAREETFADYMQKEPENDTPMANENRDRPMADENRDRIDNTSKQNKDGVGDKVALENIDIVTQVIAIGEELAPTTIQFAQTLPVAQTLPAAPVENVRAEIVDVTLAKENISLNERIINRSVESAVPVLSQQMKVAPANQLITEKLVAGEYELNSKPALKSPIVQSSAPVLANAIAAMNEPAVMPQVRPETRDVGLKIDKLEMLDKPELRIAKAAKPVTPLTANIAPAMNLLADGEPEIEFKALPTINEAAATTRSVLSISAMAASAASAPQMTNAASATAAAQVIAAIKADKNSNTIEVRLDPPELGRVRISFNMETADAVKAVLSVERAETLDHLRRNTSQFIEDLKMAGFGSVDIEFAEHGTSDFDQESEFEGFENDSSFISSQESANDIVYLSLRDDAELNLLV